MACWCFRCWSNSERWPISPSKAQVGKDGEAFQFGWRRFWRYYFVVHLAVISQQPLLNYSTSTSSNFWSQICYRSKTTSTWVACTHTYWYKALVLQTNTPFVAWYVTVYASSSCQCGMSANKFLVGNNLSWSAESKQNACTLWKPPCIVAIWVFTCHKMCIKADPLLALASNSGASAVVGNQTRLLQK